MCGEVHAKFKYAQDNGLINKRIESEYIDVSIKSIHQLTESHINTSDGYTLGRNLKHVVSQVFIDTCMHLSMSFGVMKLIMLTSCTNR